MITFVEGNCLPMVFLKVGMIGVIDEYKFLILLVVSCFVRQKETKLTSFIDPQAYFTLVLLNMRPSMRHRWVTISAFCFGGFWWHQDLLI